LFSWFDGGVSMQPSFPHPEVIGSFHQLGAFGVPYQVLRLISETETDCCYMLGFII
jgi:hypothetical protein